jgi:hypothetical protein
MVLDTLSRNALRTLGAFVCVLGLAIGTAGLAALSKSEILKSISNGLSVLPMLVFIGAWATGVVVATVQFVRGRRSDWLQMWRTSFSLPEIDVYITPKMRRETFLFTAILCGLVVLAALVGILPRYIGMS